MILCQILDGFQAETDNFLRKLKRVLKELAKGRRQRNLSSQEAYKHTELLIDALVRKQQLIRKTRTIDRALINISKNVERFQSKNFLDSTPKGQGFVLKSASKCSIFEEKENNEMEDEENRGNALTRTMSHHFGPRHYNRKVSMVTKKPRNLPDFFNEPLSNGDSDSRLWGCQSKLNDSFDGMMPFEDQSEEDGRKPESNLTYICMRKVKRLILPNVVEFPLFMCPFLQCQHFSFLCDYLLKEFLCLRVIYF